MFIIQNNNIILTKDEKIPEKNDYSLINENIIDKIDSSVWPNEEVEAISISEDSAFPEKNNLISVTFRNFILGATKAFDGLKETEKKEMIHKACRAKSLLNWRSEQKFCSVCASKMTEDKVMTALKCEGCGRILFPRIEPCIICLVKKYDENTKTEKILLARNVNNKNGFFGCIAGFIEAGETAEHCVEREVLEETGIKVKNIRYAGSQGWPFPDQLMIAYYAEYESGEIKVQEEEIAEADFFSMDNLPPLPPKGSAAYNLVFNEF